MVEMIDLDALPALDLHSEEFLRDPRTVLRPLVEQGPLARSRRGIEVLSYEWNAELYPDRRFETPDVEAFVAKGVPATFRDFLQNGFLLGFRGEHHDRIRRVIIKAFTIRRIDQQRELMRDISNRLIDEFVEAGTADLVADYTARFPVEVLCRLLGVPADDIHRFADTASELHLMGAIPIAPGFPRIEVALDVLHGYVADLVAARRAAPQEDFISALIEAERTEGKLTEDELIWNIANLLFAGQDTTRYQLASAVRALVSEPGEQWEQLAEDPALVPDALREAMRFYPTAQWNSRIALEDVEFRDVVFPKGQWVFLNSLAACRDPKAFPDPDRFDIQRGGQRYDIPFGWGLHHCVGHALARSGMEESLQILTRRLTDVHLDGEVELAKASSMVGGPERLPLSFRAR